eukprot:PITA_11405
MFDQSNHRVFASRDAIFHEQADERNRDNIYERWHILPKVEDSKVEEKVEDNEQQKLGEESNDVDITNGQSLIRSGEVLSENRGNSVKLMDEIKVQMSQVFEMKNLVEPHYYLGLEVWRDACQKIFGQAKYVRVLKIFNMDQCKVALVPMQQNVKLHFDNGSKELDGTLYRQLVGRLNYLTTTRLDLTYYVSVLSQFMARPLEIHWRATKGVLQDLKGTINYGLKYMDSFDVELTGYSHSDWVGNLDDRRSTTGYAFNIGSKIVPWRSKKQPIVSLSSTEVEYKALCVATYEVVWLRQVLQDVGEE